MTTIPEHITQRAIETARAYNRDWENGVEIIEQALLAAEKRGREEAAKEFIERQDKINRELSETLQALQRSTN